MLRTGHAGDLPLQHQGQRGRRHRREQARLKIILQISLSKVGLIAVDLGWVQLDLGCSRTQLGKLAATIQAAHQLTNPNPVHDQYDHPYSHLISQVKLYEAWAFAYCFAQ